MVHFESLHLPSTQMERTGSPPFLATDKHRVFVTTNFYIVLYCNVV